MNKITIIDKILASTFLKLIPKWVTPNNLTMFRFFTIPFVLYFLVLESYVVGLILFVISASSDALDGALARTGNQITEWGKLYDPVADKLLIGTVAAIIISKEISAILAFVIIGLELAIVLAALYQKHTSKVEIEAKKAGKVKMICQSFGIGFILLYLIFPIPLFFLLSLYLLYISIFFGLLSLFVYNSI